MIDQNPTHQHDGGYSANFNPDGTKADGLLAQTVTVPAAPASYVLSFRYADFGTGAGHSLRWEISCGGVAIGMGSVTPRGGFRLHQQVFHPTTTDVTITFWDASSNQRASGSVLDEIKVLTLASFSKAGIYSGTEVEGVKVVDSGITRSAVRKVTAAIGEDGFFSVVEQPGNGYVEGLISESGHVALLSSGGISVTTQATFTGPVIHFTADDGGSSDTGVALEKTRKFTLKKIHGLP